MTSRDSSRRKYYKSVIFLFFAYLILVPAVFYLLEPYRFLSEIADDIIMFVLKISGIALVISLLISNWIKSDPEFDE